MWEKRRLRNWIYKRIDPTTDDWRIALYPSFMPFGSGGGSVQ